MILMQPVLKTSNRKSMNPEVSAHWKNAVSVTWFSIIGESYMADSIFTDHLSREDLEEMQNWVPPVEDKNLIETGHEELHQIGADMVQRFPRIFSKSRDDIDSDLTVSTLDDC